MADVDVDVDQGKIVCDPDLTKVKKNDKIKWKKKFVGKGFRFELSFKRDKDSSTEGPDWPFGNSPPPAHDSSTGVVDEFTGTVVDFDDATYKYTVTVAGSTPLDPMIIVGRG
jgi:hypothetical protein